MIKIGDLFDIEKGSVQSSKCVEGEYDFITASEEWKTHNEYTHKCEALIFAMGASGSLGRTHYVNGKFVTSDLCFILTPKNKYKEKLNLRFYYYYFNTFREKIVSATATGTSKLAINRKILSAYKIHYIDIDKQIALIGKIECMQEVSKSIIEEITFQKNYVSSLRQAILQQAVAGKLCEQDQTDEPASVLLKKIKAEKEKLIADKKIKKQKDLPPITEEEKPFELPQGWEWCRLGEVTSIITSGSRDWAKYYSSSGAKFIRMGNLSRGSYELRMSDIQYVLPPAMGEGSRTRLEQNDILLSITGEVGLLGLIPQEFGEAYINQHTALLRFCDTSTIKYYANTMLSNLCQNQFNAPQRGIKNSFRLTDIEYIAIPLPPLAEQQRIVKKVDKLMSLCDELEQEVTSAKKYSSQLMEAVLQEAFNNDTAETRDNIIAFIPPVKEKAIKINWSAAARGDMREDTWKYLVGRANQIIKDNQ